MAPVWEALSGGCCSVPDPRRGRSRSEPPALGQRGRACLPPAPGPALFWERMLTIPAIPSSILDVSLPGACRPAVIVSCEPSYLAVCLGSPPCFDHWTDSGQGAPSHPPTREGAPSIMPLPASGAPPGVSGARRPAPSTLRISLPSRRKTLRQRLDWPNWRTSVSRAGLAGLSQQDGGGRPGWGLSCTTVPRVLPPDLSRQDGGCCGGRGASPLWLGSAVSSVSEQGHTLTPKERVSRGSEA